MIIAIDTNILIYAGMAPSVDGVDEDKRLRAQLLLHRHAQPGSQIVISNISIAEAMVPVPNREKGQFIQEMAKYFVIAPFESRSSAYAADILAQARRSAQIRKGYPRAVMTADAMIIASCKAAGAVDFFSHDSKARSIAKLGDLRAHDLPELHLDGDLFLVEDLKKGRI